MSYQYYSHCFSRRRAGVLIIWFGLILPAPSLYDLQLDTSILMETMFEGNEEMISSLKKYGAIKTKNRHF